MGERLTKGRRKALRNMRANVRQQLEDDYCFDIGDGYELASDALTKALDECDKLDKERAAEARKRMKAEARAGIQQGAKEVAEGATIATLLALSVAKAEAEYVRDQHDRDWLFTWEGGGDGG